MSENGAPDGRGPSIGAVAAVFYCFLAIAALVWVRARTGAWVPASLSGGDGSRSLLLGLLLALVTVAVTGVLLRRVSWLRWVSEEMRRLLGPIDVGSAATLALLSGVGEELFFRGAMQPVLGYGLSSVLFGLLHSGPDRRYLAWTAFAVAMGFALGGIVEWTGNLTGAVAAHVLVNFVNLLRIGGSSPASPHLPPDGD